MLGDLNLPSNFLSFFFLKIYLRKCHTSDALRGLNVVRGGDGAASVFSFFFFSFFFFVLVRAILQEFFSERSIRSFGKAVSA